MNNIVYELQTNNKNYFNTASKWISDFVGSPLAFSIAVGIILVWSIYALHHHFDSDSQMPVNTFTSVVTFWMVFLIQNAQNRDNKATNLKIDELIRTNEKARNILLKAENMSEEEREVLTEEFRCLKDEC